MTETVSQWPVPTIDFDAVMAAAVPYPSRMAEGWQIAVFEVKAGESTWNPGTTKHVIYGPCFVQYDIHPTGIVGKKIEAAQYKAMVEKIKAFEAM